MLLRTCIKEMLFFIGLRYDRLEVYFSKCPAMHTVVCYVCLSTRSSGIVVDDDDDEQDEEH